MKLFTILFFAFFILSHLSYADDAVQKWGKIEEDKLGIQSFEKDFVSSASQFEQKDERVFMDIGLVKYHYFSQCCDSDLKKIEAQLPFTENAKLDCIKYDFNNDNQMDFLLKDESMGGCENNLCPIHLFVQTEKDVYKKYDGPSIQGNKIGIPDQKKGVLGSSIFKRGMSNCEWKWDEKSDQNYMCFSEKRLQETDPKQN